MDVYKPLTYYFSFTRNVNYNNNKKTLPPDITNTENKTTIKNAVAAFGENYDY